MEKAWEEWFDSILSSLHQLGLDVERVVIEELCTGFFAKPEPPPEDPSKHSIYERRIGSLCTQLGFNLTESNIAEISERSVHSWTKYTFPDPEAEGLFRDIRTSVRTALITNFDHPPHVRSRLDELSLARHFDSVVISGEVGLKKPAPEIFSIVLDETGLTSDEVAFVGDSIDDDMMGAAAAGMIPILIRRHEDAGDVAADYGENHGSISQGPDSMKVISSLGQLREFVSAGTD